jgi:hypothetical protein
MPFFLSRGGNNVPLEVERWQYFLRKNNFAQVGSIDGDFGLKTETATRFFQVQAGIDATGAVDAATIAAARAMGFKVVPDTEYDGKKKDSWPPKPSGLSSPSNASRTAALGAFFFKQVAPQFRSDPDEIVILGSVDGSSSDWRRDEILDLEIPQKVFADGWNGRITCHRVVAPRLTQLFRAWEQADLLYLIRGYAGSFAPRYKRGDSPAWTGASAPLRSDKTSALSNHAFGTAFDINVADNPYKASPALVPKRGAVRELVELANDNGFYWGGHFSSGSRDGMHFEFAAFDSI